MKKVSLLLSFLCATSVVWSSAGDPFLDGASSDAINAQRIFDIQSDISRALGENPDADVSHLFEALALVEAENAPSLPMGASRDSEHPDDEAYARTLQREINGEGASAPATSSDLSQIDADAAYARSLQPLEPPALLEARLDEEDLPTYRQMRTDFLAIKESVDVHTMTKTFAHTYYPFLRAIEDKYFGMTRDLDEAQIMGGLGTFLADCQLPAQKALLATPEYAEKARIMMALLEKNKGFWTPGANDVDKETGISLREAFARVYFFMKRRDEEQAALFLTRHGQERQDLAYFGYFCDKLYENILTRGGCHPGISGRLVYTFAHFLT